MRRFWQILLVCVVLFGGAAGAALTTDMFGAMKTGDPEKKKEDKKPAIADGYEGKIYPLPGKAHDVGPNIGSNVTKIMKKVGDVVKEDDILYELNTTPQELSLKKAQVLEADANILAAQSNLLNAERAYKRAQKLYGGKAMSLADYQDAENLLEVRRAELSASRKRKEAAQFAYEIQEGNSTQYYYVKARGPGTITRLDIRNGQFIFPGLKPTGEIVDFSEGVQVVIYLDPEDVCAVPIGTKVRVKQGKGVDLPGKVTGWGFTGDLVTGRRPLVIHVRDVSATPADTDRYLAPYTKVRVHICK